MFSERVNELIVVHRDDDPWSQTGRDNTPFDQSFYLILNVAVGGTGGYFLYVHLHFTWYPLSVSFANHRCSDSVGGKPWVDWGSATAARDFWRANKTWLPTWGPGESRGMTVRKFSTLLT
jgi:hypothetical protein